MELNNGQVLYCAWISRDPGEEGEGGRSTSNFALASSFSSTSPLDYSVASIAEVSKGEQSFLRALVLFMLVLVSSADESYMSKKAK